MSQLYQNALYGSALILAVAVLRWVLRDRLVPEARLALWAVCLFRLLTPAAPESPFSLWGLSRLFAPQKQPGAPAAYVPDFVPAAGVPASAPQPDPGISWETVLLAIWLVVGAVLAVRYVLSWTRTRRAVSCAIPLDSQDSRYALLPKCARLREGPMEGAPLTFGAVRPTVVLSPGLEGKTLDCVLAHEGVHASRRDNLWHYVTALALVVYWWDPAVWLMSRLLRRDIELSCDRAALKRLGTDRRAEYAQALVSLATQGSDPDFCQTFGRKAAEERILSIMKFKKISVIGVIFSLTLVLALTAAFASEPKQSDEDSTGSYENTRIWSMSTDGDHALKDFSINLDYLEENLAQHVADGTMTQDEADRVMAKARKIAQNGELHWTFPADSGLVNDHLDENGSYQPGFKVFYKDPDGSMFPVDPAMVVRGFIFNEDVNDPFPFNSGSPVSGFESVKYFPMTLDDFLSGLARQEKAGNMTQAEADQRVAELLELMRVESLSDIGKISSDPLTIYASRYDYKVGGYSFGPDPKSFPEYVEQAESTVDTENMLQGEGNIVYDDDTGSKFADYKFYDYDVKLPSFDEDGNSVAADGAIIGTRYELCTLEDCGVSGSHAHVSGQVIKVDYQNPYEDSSPAPSYIPDPRISSLGNTAPSTSCGVAGCTETRYHQHSGGYCFLLSDPCPVVGCTTPGTHLHGDVCYSCNGAHSGGVCDGSCLIYSQPMQSAGNGNYSTHGHHSENHHGNGHH